MASVAFARQVGLRALALGPSWNRPLGNKLASCLYQQHIRCFSSPTVLLYQYEICPFCCKVKAILDWQRVAYRTVEVNPLSKAEIKFSKDYHKVPIAIIDGTQVNDSSEIIRVVAKTLEVAASVSEAPSFPLREALGDGETSRWLGWADKDLAVLLFPNITRSFSESVQAFGYISEVPTFSFLSKGANRLAGSTAMWLANGKIKKKYNIVDERKQLLEAVRVWTNAVGEGPFLQGATLSLSDVAVYGVLSSIRGLSTHNELMVAAPDLARWSDAVRAAIGGSMRQEEGPVVKRHIGPTAP